MRTSVDVHNYLVERDVRHELFTVRGRLRTPERLAAVLELPPQQVGKITVYESEEGPVLAVVASDREPDPERVRKAIKARELVVASAGRASTLADFLPEAIPPVALPETFRVVLDRTLAEQEVLYFAAGDPAAVLKLRGKDLARAAGATVADLV
jgi:prolyl-tRNA editing enzyme YbaK/EbsC (Cys-tRNA(Pro) deacylase)